MELYFTLTHALERNVSRYITDYILSILEGRNRDHINSGALNS
jgi:hypothetical protein